MRKEITPVKITAPSGPGLPAVLECQSFGSHIDIFEDSMAQSWATEFPSISIEQLGTQAKADSGFERHWAACVALGFSAGQRAARMNTLVEAAAVKSRAAAAAATAAKATSKTFSELVTDQISAGKSKSDSVRFCIANHPREYTLARVTGIPSL